MNEKYIIVPDGFETLTENGEKTGFQFRIRIPYYMGVPFSQIEHIRAMLDGEEIPQDQMRVVASTGEVFKMSELVSVSSYYWEYGEKLRVQILREGGLKSGEHRLDVDVAIDVIYAKKGFGSKAYCRFCL